MKYFLFCPVFLAAFSLFADAQTAVSIQGTGTQIQGRVIRTGDSQFVVRTQDNRETVFYVNPQTRYFNSGQAAQFATVQVGSQVNAWYVPAEENRFVVNTVAVIPVEAPAVPAVTPSSTAFYEGDVVRVVGKDQVIIRTGNKEIVVYVNPQTTYRVNEQPSTFTDVRVGTPVRVEYELREQRPIARGFTSVRGGDR